MSLNRRNLFRRLLLAPVAAVLGPLLVPSKRDLWKLVIERRALSMSRLFGIALEDIPKDGEGWVWCGGVDPTQDGRMDWKQVLTKVTFEEAG